MYARFWGDLADAGVGLTTSIGLKPAGFSCGRQRMCPVSGPIPHLHSPVRRPADPKILHTFVGGTGPEVVDAKGDFDRDLDNWLDDLEGRLAPAGRQTPQVAEVVAAKTADPQLGDPSTRALSEPAPGEAVGLVRREAELVFQGRELVRTEALVTIMKELASEMRSVRRDVDQVKAVVAKMRLLSEARRATRSVVEHVRPPQ